jgi:hypothetical protein
MRGLKYVNAQGIATLNNIGMLMLPLMLLKKLSLGSGSGNGM